MLFNAAFSQSYSNREQVLVEYQRPNFLSKLWTPALGPAHGTYAADCTDLADDITNQSREFYCGGPNTLLTREQTINQYRPKSASELVSLVRLIIPGFPGVKFVLAFVLRKSLNSGQ